MKLFTIGFTKKSAKDFFELLEVNNVKRVIDIRLNNVSQLAGFTKKDDLEYFLKAIGDIEYVHLDFLAPTKEILDDYKNKKITWEEYEEKYKELLDERSVQLKIQNNILDNSCLLCSEPTAEKCHRRLAAEYLKKYINEIEIVHL